MQFIIAIRESIHSVIYVCINRQLNFVNQNKIKVITGGQRGRICVAGAAALPSQIQIITLPATNCWFSGGRGTVKLVDNKSQVMTY